MPAISKAALLKLLLALAAAVPAAAAAFKRTTYADDARIVSGVFPKTLSAGQRAKVSLTVENTGKTDWKDPLVKLGAVGGLQGDAAKFLAGASPDPTRVWLDPGETVRPGQRKTFSFEIVAPKAGVYSPALQMIREGVQWFGQKGTATVKIQPAGTTAPGSTAPPSPAPAPSPSPAPAPSPSPSTGSDRATVVAATLPSSMSSGASGTFSVTVRNDGTSTWNDDWRLGVVGDMQGDGSRFLESPSLGYPDVGRIHLAQGTTVAPGQTYTFTFPVQAPTSQRTYDVKLRMVHESVQWFGDTAQQSIDVSGPPPITFPTYEAMRRFRGDLSGMHIPEIAPYNPSGTDVFFTATYPSYPQNIRDIIRARYKAKGYTHVALSLAVGPQPGYHGMYPTTNLSLSDYRYILEELWRDGLVPVVFVIDDRDPAQTPADMDAIKQKYTSMLQQLSDVIHVVVPGWEYNGWMSPDNMTESLRWLKRTLPNAMVYVHFTSGHAAGSGPSQSESGWWDSLKGVVQGILYQHDGTQGGQDLADRLADFTIRFQTGFHGWPQGFDTIAFEYSAYWETNHGQPESWGNDLGDAAMSKTSPPIQGFCDGGRLPVTGPLPSCPWTPAGSPGSAAGSTPPPSLPAPPPPAPASGFLPVVVSSAAGTTISWNGSGRGQQGFIVDIDDDGDFGNGFYNKGVGSSTSTDAPSGFNGYAGPTGALSLAAGKTYTVRVYDAASQQHSPSVAFVAAATAAPAPSPAPTPSPSPSPSSGVPADEIDLSQVVIHNSPQDVASWPAATKLTQLDFAANGLGINFTKRDGAGSWPDYTPPGWTGPIEYTVWIIIKINGQWHASGCIQYWRGLDRNGGPPSQYAMNWYYDAIRWGVMTGHQPATGEQVGFFVTAGDARNNGGTHVKERTNVVIVPFPTDAGAVFNY